jgi:hypothetical protein
MFFISLLFLLRSYVFFLFSSSFLPHLISYLISHLHFNSTLHSSHFTLTHHHSRFFPPLICFFVCVQSTFCKTIQQHCEVTKRTVHVVNLDPAAEDLGYSPSVGMLISPSPSPSPSPSSSPSPSPSLHLSISPSPSLHLHLHLSISLLFIPSLSPHSSRRHSRSDSVRERDGIIEVWTQWWFGVLHGVLG